MPGFKINIIQYSANGFLLVLYKTLFFVPYWFVMKGCKSMDECLDIVSDYMKRRDLTIAELRQLKERLQNEYDTATRRLGEEVLKESQK